MGTDIAALSTKIKSFLKLKEESFVVVGNLKGEGPLGCALIYD